MEVLGTLPVHPHHPSTELRSGRRVLPSVMATEARTAPEPTVQQPSPPSVILSLPQDPGTFSGTDNVDVEDWIAWYERVSKKNRWDDTLMLANVIFYLKGTARVWYETHEHDLTSWDLCKEKLNDLFGKPLGRQLAAKKELGSRAQSSTESYISYIQDILALCRKVDGNMSEADKIGHILKGIADDAFNLLVFRNCATVDAIVTECRRFEQAKSRRIAQQFTRLPNTAASSSCQEPLPTLQSPVSNTLTRIVRRELEAMSPAPLVPDVSTANQPMVSLIQAVVRQEVANLGLSSVCAVRVPPVAPVTPPVPPVAPRNQPFYSRYRNPAEWRTPDDRPICFACSRVGHIARHCWSRQTSPTGWSTRNPRPEGYSRTTSSRSPPTDTPDVDTRTNVYSRSPSPRDRRSRSPQARRFPSPQARRFPSPANSGRYASEN